MLFARYESGEGEEDASFMGPLAEMSDPFSILLHDLLRRRALFDSEYSAVSTSMSSSSSLAHNEESMKQYLKKEKELVASMSSTINRQIESAQQSQEILLARLKDANEYSKEDKKQLQDLSETNQNITCLLTSLSEILLNKQHQVANLVDSISLHKFKEKWKGVLKGNERREVIAEDKSSCKFCIICLENRADAVIDRSCTTFKDGRTQKFCEKRVCQCGPVVCRECLIHHFYTQSAQGTKSYARCAHCRAEFCMYDIVTIRYRSAEKREHRRHRSSEQPEHTHRHTKELEVPREKEIKEHRERKEQPEKEKEKEKESKDADRKEKGHRRRDSKTRKRRHSVSAPIFTTE